MKIVACDSWGRESEAERLVAENINNDEEAKTMLVALRNTCNDDGPVWYKLVSNEYKLWRGMEELV